MKRKNFFRNIGPILSFAVFGTFISAIIISVAIYLLGVVGLVHELPFIDSMIFGSLISAVDPVTVIAIFQSLNSDVNLHAMIFGESIMNDAVCIVLFRTMLIFVGQPADLFTVLFAVVSFFAIFIGSFVIGIGFGMVSALIFKYVDFRGVPHLETAVFAMLVYIPYLLAEGCQLSGIVTVLFNGIAQAHYTLYNLTDSTRATTQGISKTMAYIAETFVFAYLGLALFSMEHTYHITLIIASIVLCVVGRFFNIFPISAVINLIRIKTKAPRIPYKNQAILFWSGLRGAIAFALAVSVPKQCESHDAILTTTLVTVIFTIFVFGSSTYSFTKLLKIKSAEEIEDEIFDMEKSALSQPGGLSKYSITIAWLLGLDKRFLQIWLRRGVQQDLTEEDGGIFRRLRGSDNGDGVQEIELGGEVEVAGDSGDEEAPLASINSRDDNMQEMSSVDSVSDEDSEYFQPFTVESDDSS